MIGEPDGQDRCMDHDDAKPSSHRILLVLILCGAAFLRLLYVNQPFVDSINWRQTDDATIADNFFRGNANIFFPEISWNGPGPNYVGYEFQLTTYLAACLYRIFGEADYVGRGISVAFGLWGIFAFYNLVRRAFDEQYALVSCAILAIMPGAVFADRSFIPDPVMVSLTITSFWMVLAYLQDGKKTYLSVAVMTGTLGLLTKISGLIVGFPLVYVVLSSFLIESRVPGRHLGRLLVAGALVLTPVVVYYAWAIHISHTYPPYLPAAAGNWIWDDGLHSWVKAGFFLHPLAFYARWRWGPLLLGIALIGLLFPRRGAEKKNTLRWLFHWWLLAGAVFYAVGAKELVNNNWNFRIIDPALAGLAAQGLFVLGTAVAKRHLPYTAKGGFILLFLAIGLYQFKYIRDQYLDFSYQSFELGIALAHVSEPSDLMVTLVNDPGSPVAIYYSHRRGWAFPCCGDIVDDPALIEAFERLRDAGARWFGIVAAQRAKLTIAAPRLLAHIESTTELVQENTDWAIYRISAQR